jgi:hypothetical protein
MENESHSEMELTPPELLATANKATLNLLPARSRIKYESSYDQFIKWRNQYNTKSLSENILMAYFEKLSKTCKASTLWSRYSMLRSTLLINDNVNIADYKKLNAYLKRQSQGYQPKKSKTLTSADVNTFLDSAPDDKYLMTKVLFGIY